MRKYLLILFIFSLSFTYAQQRVYKQSRVRGNSIVTDYYYDYLPGSPEKGRPYRENGKIKYESTRPGYVYQAPYAPYSPYYYGYEREGRPYRDKSGKIRYEKEYIRYPVY